MASGSRPRGPAPTPDQPGAQGPRTKPPDEAPPLPGPYPARAAAGWPSLRRRTPTGAQIAAVRVVMRLFADDDLANGVSPERRQRCAACRSWQPAPGFVEYERLAFCNVCATAYEIDRLRGVIDAAPEYVALLNGRVSA